ncbi:hypothetical protein IWX91DRAFT_344641 [Phyllosticta citricarpa]
MSTTTVTSAAIVGIVLVAAVIGGVLGLHFWRKRVERLQAVSILDSDAKAWSSVGGRLRAAKSSSQLTSLAESSPSA